MDRRGYEQIDGLLKDSFGAGFKVTAPEDRDIRFVDISYPSDLLPGDMLNVLDESGLVYRESRLGYEGDLVGIDAPRLRVAGYLPGLIGFEDMNAQNSDY